MISDRQSKDSHSNILSLLIKSILLFTYIYAVPLEIFGLPSSMHSARLSAILIVVIGLFNWVKWKKTKDYCAITIFKKVSVVIIFTFLYALSISMAIGFGRGSNIVNIVFDTIMFSIIPFWGFLLFFDDIDDLVNALIIVTVLQSAAILLATFIPAVSVFFTNVLGSDMGMGEERDLDLLRESYASGISCFTSEGVCKYTIGLIACSYKYLSTFKNRYFVLYVFFSVIDAMLARTGLIMALFGVFVMIMWFLKKRLIGLKFLVGLVFLMVSALLIWDFLPEDFHDRFKRFGELEESEGFESFFTAYFSGDYPPISLETMLGTSIISGVSGNGIKVRVDGGFIKNYVALGLPIAVFVYWYIYRSIWQSRRIFKNSFMQYIILFYFLYLLLAEFKEYYLLYRGSILMFFLFVTLAERKFGKKEQIKLHAKYKELT